MMAITPFKVTNFGTNRKLICDFPLVINTNTYILPCTVSKLWLIIGQMFACDSWWPHFNSLASGDPLRISRWSLPLQKLEWFCYLTVKPHDRSFICLDKTPECVGRTDGQTDRAVAITAVVMQTRWNKTTHLFTCKIRSRSLHLHHFGISEVNIAWSTTLNCSFVLSKRAKFGAKIFVHFWDVTIFALGYFFWITLYV